MNVNARVLETFQWLAESRAEAERVVPELLDLPIFLLERELEQHHELRPGILQSLLCIAEQSVDRSPLDAHALALAVAKYARFDVPPERKTVAIAIEGKAWTVHAAALRALGFFEEAELSIFLARSTYEGIAVNAWHAAATDLVYVQILQDLGKRDDALLVLRRTAEALLLHGDRERYVQARMIEASLFWDAGDHHAARDVWRNVIEVGTQRGDAVLLARMESRIGVFELRHGSPEKAAGRFASAHEAFDTAGLRREAAHARRRLGAAALFRGRIHEALSEYYKAQAVFLEEGAVVDAAITSAEILELLLAVGRNDEVLQQTRRLPERFANAGLPWNALPAWTFLRTRARNGQITWQDINRVRDYFEDLPLQPNASFSAGGSRP